MKLIHFLVQVDSLVAGLNPRGEREGELRDRLVLQRDRIERRIRKCQTNVLTRSEEDAEKLEAAMVAEVEKRRVKVGTLGCTAHCCGTGGA